MGELRMFFVEGLGDFVTFVLDTPCPKLPARVLLADSVQMVSLNIRKGDTDCYTMVPYEEYFRSHHV